MLYQGIHCLSAAGLVVLPSAGGGYVGYQSVSVLSLQLEQLLQGIQLALAVADVLDQLQLVMQLVVQLVVQLVEQLQLWVSPVAFGAQCQIHHLLGLLQPLFFHHRT